MYVCMYVCVCVCVYLLCVCVEIDYISSGGAKGGRDIYRDGNFARKRISTSPVGAPIYIWPRAAIPLIIIIIIIIIISFERYFRR